MYTLRKGSKIAFCKGNILREYETKERVLKALVNLNGEGRQNQKTRNRL
jgi:hypothetical protein